MKRHVLLLAVILLMSGTGAFAQEGAGAPPGTPTAPVPPGEEMKALTHKVNAILKPLFANAGIDLVDYKLEFGHPTEDPQGRLVLGDEFTPDGCRLWDAKSGEKMDKDRFRRDLGSVIEHYREVARRIGAPF